MKIKKPVVKSAKPAVKKVIKKVAATKVEAKNASEKIIKKYSRAIHKLASR